MVSAVVEQLVDVASLTLTAVIGVVVLRVTLVLATPERVLVGGVLNEEAMLVVAVDNDAESEEVTTASPALAALAAVVYSSSRCTTCNRTHNCGCRCMFHCRC